MTQTQPAEAPSFWTTGRILAVVLALLVLALAIANFDDVEINFLLFKVTLPKFFMIAGSLAVGYVVGWLSRKPASKR